MRTMVHAVHTINLGSRDRRVGLEPSRTLAIELLLTESSGLRLRSFVGLMAEMRYAQMLGIETLVFQ